MCSRPLRQPTLGRGAAASDVDRSGAVASEPSGTEPGEPGHGPLAGRLCQGRSPGGGMFTKSGLTANKLPGPLASLSSVPGRPLTLRPATSVPCMTHYCRSSIRLQQRNQSHRFPITFNGGNLRRSWNSTPRRLWGQPPYAVRIKGLASLYQLGWLWRKRELGYATSSPRWGNLSVTNKGLAAILPMIYQIRKD